MTKERVSPSSKEISKESKIEPEGLFELMKEVHRPYYGHENQYEKLQKVARQLCRKELKERVSEEIEICGWDLVEEMHGGYEGPGGHFREVLGKGNCLYKKSFQEIPNRRYGYQSISTSIEVEAWKQGRKVIFLAIRETVESGYVGIDNHYGTDTSWEVISLRFIDL